MPCDRGGLDPARGRAAAGAPATLTLEGLRYRYGRRGPLVLDDVSATFRSRSVAVLGPNGAGKSTLFSLLSTARTADAGTFAVDGEPLGSTARARRDYRSTFAIVPQRLRVAPGYRCDQFLRYVAWLKKVPVDLVDQRVDSVLRQVDLAERAGSRVGALSGGMHQRLCLAAGLVNEPRLLLLDEPTVGLDPVQRSDLLTHLAAATSATTLVMATHLVEDVAALADEVLVLTQGRAVFAGDIATMCRTSREAVTGADVEAAYRRLAHPTDRSDEAPP